MLKRLQLTACTKNGPSLSMLFDTSSGERMRVAGAGQEIHHAALGGIERGHRGQRHGLEGQQLLRARQAAGRRLRRRRRLAGQQLGGALQAAHPAHRLPPELGGDGVPHLLPVAARLRHQHHGRRLAVLVKVLLCCWPPIGPSASARHTALRHCLSSAGRQTAKSQ